MSLLSVAISFALGCYALASVLVLVRVVRGPRAQDRVFALDLLYLHAILVMLVKATDRQKWMVSALALVFSGAIGNVIDRFRFQKVTDFVLWEVSSFSWPVFNVADVALVVGVVILFFDVGKEQKKK